MQDYKKAIKQPNNNTTMAATALASAVTLGIAAACIFRVAKPSQYLVQTGWRINDKMGMRISRKAFVLPVARRLHVVNMEPRNLHFDLKCLSAEYLPFKVPVTYTISPFDPTDPEQTEVLHGTDAKVSVSGEDLFKRYVQKIEPLSRESFESVVLGVVHGTTRILAAKMPIDTINDDRDKFNAHIITNVQDLLMQYGLRVDNANIAELTEEKRAHGERGYLEARERKKLSEAVQQSEVFVAEATKEGDIGKKQREASTRQENARLEANTKQIEFDTQQTIATASADLEVVKSTSKKREEISRIEAEAAAHVRKEELQLKIEMLREEQLLIAKRAEKLTTNKVSAECTLVDARAKGDAMMAEASGRAQATEITAKAIRFEGEQKAAVILANLKAEADGKHALLMAQADGTKQLVMACDGRPELLSSILSIYNEIPQTMARENAKAVQGLAPQIWSLSGDSAGAQIANILGSLNPVVDMYKKISDKKPIEMSKQS